MNLEDVSKRKGAEDAVKNQYYNYSNPDADTNLDDLANGVSKVDIAYGSSIGPQTRGSANYADEEGNSKGAKKGWKNRIRGTVIKCPNCGEPFSTKKFGDDRLLAHLTNKHKMSSAKAQDITEDIISGTYSEAEEGGWKSGKKGHLPYMKSIEFGADLKDCPNCEVNVQSENGKCPICNKDF